MSTQKLIAAYMLAARKHPEAARAIWAVVPIADLETKGFRLDTENWWLYYNPLVLRKLGVEEIADAIYSLLQPHLYL
jgi:hypothetical protein